MRTRKRDQKNLVKVGIFLTGLIAVLTIMIASIGKQSSLFANRVDIMARVLNVSNLKQGSYVELKGIRIGSVSKISIISDEEVEITMNILESELKWIKQDAKVAISTAGLVGDKFVEIYNGTKEAPALDPKVDFLKAEDSTDIKKIMVKGESIANSTDRLLEKLNNMLSQLDDGKTVVKMVSSLNKTADNLEKITAELKEAHIGEMAKNVSKTSASLERILTRVEKGPGTMNSLIYDDSVHEDLRVLLGGAQRNNVIKYFIRESIKKSENKMPQKN